MKKIINQIYCYFDFEAVFWIIGIILLAFSNPYSETHYTFTLPTILFDIHGPGYNLGHSISHFFHGNIVTSLKINPLGIITIFVLLGRSFQIFNRLKINSTMKGNING